MARACDCCLRDIEEEAVLISKNACGRPAQQRWQCRQNPARYVVTKYGKPTRLPKRSP